MKPQSLKPVYDDFLQKIFAEKQNRAQIGREVSDKRSEYMEENFRHTWQTWKDDAAQFNQTFQSSIGLNNESDDFGIVNRITRK